MNFYKGLELLFSTRGQCQCSSGFLFADSTQDINPFLAQFLILILFGWLTCNDTLSSYFDCQCDGIKNQNSTCVVLNPIKEKTKVPVLCCVSILKVPSELDTVPVVVDFTTMFVPPKGTPS